eukprot:14956111-Alexandrium_andersonii.AAC.1
MSTPRATSTIGSGRRPSPRKSVSSRPAGSTTARCALPQGATSRVGAPDAQAFTPSWACKGRELRYWSPGATLPNAYQTGTRAWLEQRQRLSAAPSSGQSGP